MLFRFLLEVLTRNPWLPNVDRYRWRSENVWGYDEISYVHFERIRKRAFKLKGLIICESMEPGSYNTPWLHQGRVIWVMTDSKENCRSACELSMYVRVLSSNKTDKTLNLLTTPPRRQFMIKIINLKIVLIYHQILVASSNAVKVVGSLYWV